MLKQAQSDISVFPTTITKDEYNQVKLHKDDYDDWYVGLVGFCASYNGKWFGGYANNVKTKIGMIRNYTDEAIKNLIKQSSNLKDVIFSCCDFRDINKNIKDFVIYYDIPYRNTTKYSGKQDFPYDEFYKQCKELNKNNIVLISEYNMPNDFECIWEKEIECTLDKNKRGNRVEKLFICK